MAGWDYCDTCNGITGCCSHTGRPHAIRRGSFEEAQANERCVNCYAYVTWVLVKCGYFQTNQDINTEAGIKDLKSKGWQDVTSEVRASEANLQPGDIISWGKGGSSFCHGEIYAGNGLVLSCGHKGAFATTSLLSNRNHADRYYAYVLRPPQ